MNESLLISLRVDDVDVHVGTAHLARRRHVLSSTFRYSTQYLARRDAFAVDPAFGLFSGVHQSAGVPAAFADSAPDLPVTQ